LTGGVAGVVLAGGAGGVLGSTAGAMTAGSGAAGAWDPAAAVPAWVASVGGGGVVPSEGGTGLSPTHVRVTVGSTSTVARRAHPAPTTMIASTSQRVACRTPIDPSLRLAPSGRR